MAKLEAKPKSKKRTSPKKLAGSASAKTTKKKTSSASTESKKQQSDSQKVSESNDVARPSTRGLSLGVKLGFTIAAVSVLVAFAAGYIIASQTKNFLTDEILKSGISGVKFLASQGRTVILNNYEGNETNVVEFKEKIKEKLKDSNITDLPKSRISGLETPIMDGYITLMEANFGKEEKIFSLNESKKGLSTKLKYGKTIKKEDSVPSLTVRQVTLTRNNIDYPVYEFQMDLNLDLKDRFKERNFQPSQGTARLFLSTAKILESEREVYRVTAIILAVAFIASILIALLLSRSITKPILQLVKDMSVVSRGDLDHKTLAHSSDEVGYLSTTFNQLTESLKTAHEAEIEKEKLEHDLQVGREIQQNLLPKTLYKIPGYDLDAFYLSAKEVGGDYYDLIPIDKSKLGVVVADVSGKGIQGAMLMTIMRTVMNIAAVGNLSTQNCLGRTNRFLSDRIKRGMFVTSFYTILDCRKGTLKFSSAGHNPMIIYRAKEKKIELLNPTGIALGFDKGPLFEKTLKEGETQLKKGDRFVLYTDGVVESMNEQKEEYSDQRFYDFVMENAVLDSKTFIHKLVIELKKHQGNAPQHDDITIVTFRKN